MIKRLLLIALMSGALSACGFALRGKLPLSETISVIAVKSIETTGTALKPRMEEALRVSGATVVPDSAVAKATLDLYEVKLDRKVRTIDTRGKVTGYTLEYTVRFKVVSADGRELSNPPPMYVRRDFNFDPNQVLQKEDEERELLEQIEKEISQRILRQLVTIAALPLRIAGVLHYGA